MTMLNGTGPDYDGREPLRLPEPAEIEREGRIAWAIWAVCFLMLLTAGWWVPVVDGLLGGGR